jgi:hypothetical protein
MKIYEIIEPRRKPITEAPLFWQELKDIGVRVGDELQALKDLDRSQLKKNRSVREYSRAMMQHIQREVYPLAVRHVKSQQQSTAQPQPGAAGASANPPPVDEATAIANQFEKLLTAMLEKKFHVPIDNPDISQALGNIINKVRQENKITNSMLLEQARARMKKNAFIS